MSVTPGSLRYAIGEKIVQGGSLKIEYDSFVDACKTWGENPTEENAERVNRTYRNLEEAGIDTLLYPMPIEDLLTETAKHALELLENEGTLNSESLEEALEAIHEIYPEHDYRNRIERNLCEPHLADSQFVAPRRDPIVLDLDGDGIDLFIEDFVLFDGDGDDIKEGSIWINSDDGFLVLDLNNNGSIDNGKELFGTGTVLSNEETAADGFEALVEIDSNSDGFIDENDQEFSNLQIWRDLNTDGVSQSGELFALSDYGVTKINISGDDGSIEYWEETRAVRTSTYTDSNSNTLLVASMEFEINPVITEVIEKNPLPIDLIGKPGFTGMGSVRSLLYAASDDQNLKNLYIDYINAPSNTRIDLIEELVKGWALTSDSISRTIDFGFEHISKYIDDDPSLGETERYKELKNMVLTLEAFSGRNQEIRFFTIERYSQISASYSWVIEEIRQVLEEKILGDQYASLIEFKEINGSFTFDFTLLESELNTQFSIDLDSALADFANMIWLQYKKYENFGFDVGRYFQNVLDNYTLDTDHLDILSRHGVTFEDNLLTLTREDTAWSYNDGANAILSHSIDFFKGGRGDDDVIGSGHLDGGGGNDTLTGFSLSNNTLLGGSGDDLLRLNNTDTKSRYKSNTFNGGIGNDTLLGEASADTYIFNLGDGQDVIKDNSQGFTTEDKVLLGPGITPDDVTIARDGKDLLIQIGSTDQITIQSWYKGASYHIEKLEFDSGTIWDAASLDGMGRILEGTSGDDVLSGLHSSADEIYGFGGNDTINGNGGSDLLYGGAGDDTITVGYGESVAYGEAGHDTLTGHYYSNNTLYGGIGNDILQLDSTDTRSRYRSNIFEGGAGNDTLLGQASADTYIFNLGDGQDVIKDNSQGFTTEDKVLLGPGITPDDVTIARDGKDLLIQIGSTDQITIQSWYKGASYHIEKLEFDSGTIWDAASLDGMGRILEGTSGDDVLSGLHSSADEIYGFGGNDTINGNGGSDLLYGGAGDDTITVGYGESVAYGEDGNDTLVGYYYNNNTLNGGAGNDVLKLDTTNGNSRNRSNIFEGGQGNDLITGSYSADTYVFNLGDGQDFINDYGGGYAKEDRISLGAGLESGELWFSQVGNNLVIDYLNGDDQVTVNNWFSSTYYQIESIETSDEVLISSQVNQLVQAMAVISPSAPSSIDSLTTSQQEDVSSAITAAWEVKA